MDNINHQNQNSPHTLIINQIENLPPQVQHPPTCYCTAAMTLKLKLINLSSENQVLKKKLTSIELQLEKYQRFQQLYHSAVIAQKAALSRSKQTTNSDDLSLIARTATQQQNTINAATLKESRVVRQEITQKRDQSPRLQSYEHFRKLAAEDKQTVKSLQFSFDSKQWEESQTKLQFDQQQFFSLREEYQQMLQNLESNSQKKISQLQEQIQKLASNNHRLQQIVRTSQEYIKESEEYQIRKTAQFKPIREEDNEESVSEIQAEQTQISQILNLPNFNESCSLSTQNLLDVAQQMRYLKSTLQQFYELLRTLAHQLKTIITLCKLVQQMQNQAKIVPINEYPKLSENKKRDLMAVKKCALLSAQNQELRQIINELIHQH